MRQKWLAGAVTVFGLMGSGQVLAAGAPAGVDIQNTASVNYTVGSTSATATSNTVSLKVAEILDVVVTLQSGVVTVTPGAANQVLVYRVTNTGNGQENFLLALNSVLGGDDFDPVPASPSIYFDTDGNGTLSAADTPYVAGSNDPQLNPDAFVTLLVVNNIPNGLSNGNRGLSQFSATSRTGTGAPGTSFAGQGTGGTDAVVGTTTATANRNGEYLVADIAIAANKTATVVDQFGGARPIPGARINYQVVVTATGTGTAVGAAFADLIPANTTYVPGSLKLNAVALTDASDADVGNFVAAPAAQVRVGLGNLTQANGPQTILFSVTIN
jgi:uncharacterized repeat protein (TIGR01451 family)